MLQRFAVVSANDGPGAVLHAHDTRLDRDVSIKLLTFARGSVPDLDEKTTELRRTAAARQDALLREARAMAQLSHPNVLPVYEVGLADGALFLVMPLIAGGSLEQARARFGDAAWATPVLAQIARGLAALHERGVVHRDLKPGNVLLANGVARIADFGLAHMTDGEQTLPSLDDAYAATAAPLTRAGDVFGTPRYMAPELARGAHAPAPSSDVFAFGVIAVELLANRAPFAEPPVLARLDGRTPAAATLDGVTHRELLARCLGLDPEQRPTADELVRAFSA